MFHTNDIINAISDGLDGINHLESCIASEEDLEISPCMIEGKISDFSSMSTTEFIIFVKTCPTEEELEFFKVLNHCIKMDKLDTLIELIKEVPLYNDVYKQFI